MKTRTLTLLLLGALAMGCETDPDARDAASDAADAAPEALPEVGSDGTAPAPRIVFDETDVDAGHVAYSTPVTHAYRFHNAGDAPLVLTLPLPPIEALEGC